MLIEEEVIECIIENSVKILGVTMDIKLQEIQPTIASALYIELFVPGKIASSNERLYWITVTVLLSGWSIVDW